MTKLQPINLPKVTDSRFDAVDPLDCRYYDVETARYLSDESRVAYQAYVEAALAWALADTGICSQAVAKDIEAATRKVTAADV